ITTFTRELILGTTTTTTKETCWKCPPLHEEYIKTTTDLTLTTIHAINLATSIPTLQHNNETHTSTSAQLLTTHFIQKWYKNAKNLLETNKTILAEYPKLFKWTLQQNETPYSTNAIDNFKKWIAKKPTTEQRNIYSILQTQPE